MGHHRGMKIFAPSPLLRALLPAFALLAAVSAAPPVAAQRQVSQAQPTLPIVTLQAGIHRIRAELAATAPTREIGLMHRESLAPNHGMLFVFDDKGGYCFWMRNTLIPLSIAFVDDDGSIVNIADMAPGSEQSHCPSKAVRFALEMEQGWFEKRGIGPGEKLVNSKIFSARR